MNPWDIQSKHVFDVSGICEALYSCECRYGGGEHYVCYEVNNEQCKLPKSVGFGREKDIFNRRSDADIVRR